MNIQLQTQATIILFDTGDGSPSKTGALPMTRRAGYDGNSTVNPFELFITGYTWNAGGSILEEPVQINNAELSRLSPTSSITYRNPVIVLNCRMSKDQIPESGYNIDWFYQLSCLERTKGVKLLAITQNFTRDATMIERYGKFYATGPFQSDLNTLLGTSGQVYRYVPVFVKSVGNVTDNASRDTINFDITCRIAG